MPPLPTEALSPAEFIVRHLYRPLEVAETAQFSAVTETEHLVGGDNWFWLDDNAKVLGIHVAAGGVAALSGRDPGDAALRALDVPGAVHVPPGQHAAPGTHRRRRRALERGAVHPFADACAARPAAGHGGGRGAVSRHPHRRQPAAHRQRRALHASRAALFGRCRGRGHRSRRDRAGPHADPAPYQRIVIQAALGGAAARPDQLCLHVRRAGDAVRGRGGTGGRSRRRHRRCRADDRARPFEPRAQRRSLQHAGRRDPRRGADQLPRGSSGQTPPAGGRRLLLFDGAGRNRRFRAGDPHRAAPARAADRAGGACRAAG